MDLCWQSNVSVFNMLSTLVITFLPRSMHLLISWLQSLSAVIFGAPKNKVSHCLHCFPSIYHEVHHWATELNWNEWKTWKFGWFRKWRTKGPLDESERGEWKSWLKAQHFENKDYGICFHRFMSNRWGNSGRYFIFGAPKSLQMVTAAMKLKDAYSLEDKLRPT